MDVSKITTDSGKQGHDLNDVIRDVLRRLMDDRKWSENRAAKALGISQRTLNRFLKREQGVSVRSFSKLCSELEVNPVDFFRGHPLYDEETRSRIRFAKDALYDRFRMVLALDEARKVLHSLEEQKRLAIFEVCSQAIEGMIEVAKAARRQAFREAAAATPRSGRRRPPA